MSDQQINVHVQSGTGEVLRIVATLLLFGGAGAIAWSVAQGAYKEQAATGLSMMIATMVSSMWARGMIRIPDNGQADHFKANREMAAQLGQEWANWRARMSMPAMAATAAGYAVAFLIMRAAVAAALGVFQNLYIAAGAAAMVGALVVFPSLIPGIIASIKRRGVVAAPEPVAASRVEPQVIAAPVAPAAQAAPSSPAPKAAAPVTGPTAPDASPRPRVMRRVTNPNQED